jgi:hypothetical protein
MRSILKALTDRLHGLLFVEQTYRIARQCPVCDKFVEVETKGYSAKEATVLLDQLLCKCEED